LVLTPICRPLPPPCIARGTRCSATWRRSLPAAVPASPIRRPTAFSCAEAVTSIAVTASAHEKAVGRRIGEAGTAAGKLRRQVAEHLVPLAMQGGGKGRQIGVRTRR